MRHFKKTLAVLTIGVSLGYGLASFTLPVKDRLGEPRITGIGGIFFKTPDPTATRAWYEQHLGFKVDQYGTLFEWRLSDSTATKGYLQWSAFNDKSKYFDGDYMINYRVVGLEELLVRLRDEGVEVVDTLATYDYGKFVHIRDLNGTKIELWEPVDSAFEKYAGGAITK